MAQFETIKISHILEIDEAIFHAKIPIHDRLQILPLTYVLVSMSCT